MQKITLPVFSLSSHALADQIILITGASSGIGRALALLAAQHGATTILLGKSLKKLESLYDEIVEKGYPEPAIHPLNLLQATPKEADTLAASIGSLFGRLNAVVHNAGSIGQISPIEHLPAHKWQEAIYLNLHIPFLLTQSLLPLLKTTTDASILFTVAEEAFHSKAYWSAFAASKAGVLGFAQSLHEECEANTSLRINCIHPGKVRTAMRLNAYPGVDPNTFPLPENIVPSYLYLLSSEAKAIRGKVVELTNI